MTLIGSLPNVGSSAFNCKTLEIWALLAGRDFLGWGVGKSTGGNGGHEIFAKDGHGQRYHRSRFAGRRHPHELGVADFLAFEGRNQFLAMRAAAAAVKRRRITPKTWLPPHVQIANHLGPAGEFPIRFFLMLAPLTTMPFRPSPGDLEPMSFAITLISLRATCGDGADRPDAAGATRSAGGRHGPRRGGGPACPGVLVGTAARPGTELSRRHGGVV